MPRHHSLAKFELLVLIGLVRLCGSAFGGDLRREIEDRTERGVSLGALYATLTRLETRRLVKHEVTEARPVKGGRARKRFIITRRGTAELQIAVDELRNMLQDLPPWLPVPSR